MPKKTNNKKEEGVKDSKPFEWYKELDNIKDSFDREAFKLFLTDKTINDKKTYEQYYKLFFGG